MNWRESFLCRKPSASRVNITWCLSGGHMLELAIVCLKRTHTNQEFNLTLPTTCWSILKVLVWWMIAKYYVIQMQYAVTVNGVRRVLFGPARTSRLCKSTNSNETWTIQAFHSNSSKVQYWAVRSNMMVQYGTAWSCLELYVTVLYCLLCNNILNIVILQFLIPL